MAGTLLLRSEEELRELDRLDELWAELSREVGALDADDLTLGNVLKIVKAQISGEQALKLVARDLLEAAESELQI